MLHVFRFSPINSAVDQKDIQNQPRTRLSYVLLSRHIKVDQNIHPL